MITEKNIAASRANMERYNALLPSKYVNGAPHIKHRGLFNMYSDLIFNVYQHAEKHTPVPRVLDIGAGEGTATRMFLSLGARVTAVDISKKQLDALEERCSEHADRLSLHCGDALDTLGIFSSRNQQYDIIVASSFLHHVPDYLSLVRSSVALLNYGGQFFSFQDPLRYDTLKIPTWLFSNAAYLSWRVFQGDIVGMIKRTFKRRRGLYSPEDDVEYHVQRGGVDHNAILAALDMMECYCDLICYFSTQNNICQLIGSLLCLKNTFGVIARKEERV
jgi:2-polyprenyl-3-methyl-5-hydroxy-6-metoxy-1,4-benzoquinol methylase